MKNLGLIINVNSDFLLNDVNFALTSISNNKVFHHVRNENNNKMLIENLPGGNYELIIYAHNCLSNLDKNAMI